MGIAQDIKWDGKFREDKNSPTLKQFEDLLNAEVQRSGDYFYIGTGCGEFRRDIIGRWFVYSGSDQWKECEDPFTIIDGNVTTRKELILKEHK